MTSYTSMLLNPWTAAKIPDLRGKIAVVTGGGEGIGAAFICELLRHSIDKVHLVSNDRARYQEVQETWNKECGSDVASKTVFHEADLGDYDRIRVVARQILKDTPRIDIVNLNAAIGMYSTDVPSKAESPSHAIDRHFACNNVDHAVLLSGLLPAIKKTASEAGDARFVIMASNLHFQAPSNVNFSSLDELNEDLGPTLQYNRSKLANVLYCKKLHRMFQEEGLTAIKVNCCHPGVVKTAQQDGVLESYGDKIETALGDNIAADFAKSTLSTLNHAARSIAMKDSPAGALSTLYAATSEEVSAQNISGEYIVPNGHVQEADKRASQVVMQDSCYKLIEECIQKGLGNIEGADHQEGSMARGSATM